MAEWAKPPDWSDVERMNFLCSPLPENRADKPSKYDAQTEFWSSLVVSSCKDCSQVSVSGKQLEERFTRFGRKPTCLPGIMKHACSRGILRSLSSFETSCRESWLEWGTSLAYGWISDSVVGTSNGMDTVYIIPRLVEEFSMKVLAQHSLETRSSSSNSSTLLTDEMFSSLCRRVYPAISDLDVKTIRHWLKKSSKLCIAPQEDVEGPELIKLASNAESRAAAVSKRDIALFQLQKCSTVLNGEIERYAKDIKTCFERAKEMQKLGSQNSAVLQLRRRKRLLKMMSQKEGALHNVTQLLDDLVSAEDDKAVVEALAGGRSAYRDALAGMDHDKLEDMIDDVRDLRIEHEDISAALSGELRDPLDEDELEAELAELESVVLSDSVSTGTGELRDPLDEDELEAELAELESVVLSDGVSTGTGELRDPLDEDELEAELAELESVVLSDGVSTGTGTSHSPQSDEKGHAPSEQVQLPTPTSALPESPHQAARTAASLPSQQQKQIDSIA